MGVPARIAGTAIAAALAAAVPAHAAQYCVEPLQRPGCTPAATLTAALDAADDDPAADEIHLAALSETPPATYADGDRPVAIVGSGPATSVLGAPLRLAHPASTVTAVRIAPAGAEAPALALAGAAWALEVRAPGDGVLALPGSQARVRQLALQTAGEAALIADGARLVADDVDAVLAPGAGGALLARCRADGDAVLLVRHVTVSGGSGPTARSDCEFTRAGRSARLELRSSILPGGDPFSLDGGEAVSAFSAHAADAELPASAVESRIDGDPKLDELRRPAPGSPVVDRGDPAPLAPGDEPLEDAGGVTRVTDGDGDGAVRRDAGAYELQPPAVPLPAGNVLANPGAEDGREDGSIAGWSGTFARGIYGSDAFFPGVAAAEALGAGAAFFTGAGEPAPRALQRIDVAASARAIDAGGATAALSGLLGGYAADADAATVSAVFRDPEGRTIGPPLTIGPVTPADRGNATNLLPRRAAGAIPPRTRAIDVVVAGELVATPGERYTDAYADNVALVPSVPGVPADPPVRDDAPIVSGLKPFTGVVVLHPRVTATRSGAVRIALACASSTVGPCRGVLELRATLPRRRAAGRIARFASFVVAPGRRRGVTMRLLASARRALRGRRSIRVTLVAVAVDGQGLQRRRTVPLRLRLPR